MEVEESIVQLGEKLDAWWDGFSAMLYSEDRVAQGKALLRGFEIAKELDRIKADGLAAITAFITHQDLVTKYERATSLIRGFAFAAKLRAVLRDEFRDTAGVTKVAHLMDAIINALDTIGSRSALAVLLDDLDSRVRASAGAYLISLMPERVIPILRDVEHKEHANSAHFTAYWTLLRWEREGKHVKR